MTQRPAVLARIMDLIAAKAQSGAP